MPADRCLCAQPVCPGLPIVHLRIRMAAYLALPIDLFRPGAQPLDSVIELLIDDAQAGPLGVKRL